MSRSRDRVVQVLERAGAPVGLAEIAAAAGLQPHAARHHLAALEAAGRIVAQVDRAGQRGRPRLLWFAPPAPAGPYERLALALVRARRTGEALEDAGRAVAPLHHRAGDGDVVGFLETEGFDPHAEGDTIRLARCPLEGAVAADAAAVCEVHRGLVAAVAEQCGETVVLEARTPGQCRLRRVPPDTPVTGIPTTGIPTTGIPTTRRTP